LTGNDIQRWLGRGSRAARRDLPPLPKEIHLRRPSILVRSLSAASNAVLGTAALVLVACNGLPVLPIDRYVPKYEPSKFVHWETPHVSPLAFSPDGGTLLAVNTPDARLEVFDTAGETLVSRASIPVGIDPVSVRFRNASEAWVVNHVSDSISIVDLNTSVVVRTLECADEPADVAFAAGRAFVTCSQVNAVQVFDLADLAAAPITLDIRGKNPRALAISPDGATVYAAIFESGNHTTLVPWESVSDPAGPYGGVNPPPNAGVDFSPALNPELPVPPPVSIIVRKDPATGAWLDDAGADWRDFVFWDQHDHDVAAIDAATLEVRYISGLMTTNMQLAVGGDGTLAVIGTEATNDVRYEPNLTGQFVHSVLATIGPTNSAVPTIRDLNPHLAEAYAAHRSSVPDDLRSRSIADPRAIVFSADGARGYVAGMGSNNVIVIDAAGQRLAEIAVGQGPTGLALDDSRKRLFVLNKFDATIDVIAADSLAITNSVSFFDPTPSEVRVGRPFLYDAHRTSGLGVTACGACHVDGRMDQLAWDLGDPSGAMKSFNQECNRPVLDIPVGPCEDFHPMKGPMTTQTLQNIIGTEPFHWRGDREGIEAFNPAFVGLLGGDRQLLPEEMEAFKAFLATISFPPNPNRNLDDSFKDMLDGGRPASGETIFFNQGIDLTIAKCNDCHDTHERGAGTNHAITPRNLLVNPNQSIDVPQIRNMYEKAGFSRGSLENNLGFGNNHDGAIDGLFSFFHIANFTGFADGQRGDQQRRDVIAYVMSFATDTHPGVGAQLTLDAANAEARDVQERLDLLLRLARRGVVGLIAKGRIDGVARGFVQDENGDFLTDRAADPPLALADLVEAAAGGATITFTLVPSGTQLRMGIDRDDDGVLDGDE
jgi:YVTN family beta-propeller protein